jgi:putative phosphoribosyl transferase
LAERLAGLGLADPVALGLPRGGVVVAAAVADALGWPLDVLLVRKVGVPRQPELAMGAIGELGAKVVNDHVMSWTSASDADFERVADRERVELQRRAERYRGGRPPVDLAGRSAVVIDDGIATGATAAASVQVARSLGADRVVLAVPVAPPDSVERFTELVDDFVALEVPDRFSAVGEWYRDFDQTSDDEVIDLLERFRGGGGPAQ